MIIKEKKCNYLYAADDNFAKVLGVSIYSLCEKNKDYIDCIYIISQGISKKNKDNLNVISNQFACKIEFIEMPNFDQILEEKTDIKRYSLSMFSRILIDTLLPKDLKKIIYLDCDTMVNSELLDLWEYDLQNNTIGAVNDYRSIYYQKNLKISKSNCYINSGVLLINVELYRQRLYEKKIIQIIKQYNGIFEFPDNDAICKVMQDDMVLLPLKFNVSSVFFMTSIDELKILRKPNIIDSDDIIEESKEKPSIIHFTTCFLMDGRPWIKGCNHPLVDEYLKIYKKTPWKKEDLLENRKGFKRSIVKIIPRKILIHLCGILHAYIKPYFQSWKFKMKERKKN